MASRKGLSPAAARLSRRFRSPYVFHIVVLQPPHCRNRAGLGSSPVARRYWGNHSYFLFLPLLRCFSSRRWLPDWPDGTPPACRVFPFGHPRVKGRLHLAAAFRSLPRWEPRHPPYALSHFERTCTIPKKTGRHARRVSLGSHFAYLALRFFTTFSCRNMSLNALLTYQERGE